MYPALRTCCLLLLSGCAYTGVNVTRPEAIGDPSRILVVVGIQEEVPVALGDAVRSTLRAGLTRCGVTTEEFVTERLGLNQAARLASSTERFRPDMIMRLAVGATVRGSNLTNQLTLSGTPTGDRLAWIIVTIGESAELADDQTLRGQALGQRLLARIEERNLVPACRRAAQRPLPPPATTGITP